MPKHSRLTNSTIAITAYLVLGPLARADCVAPRALEAALRSHPDAKIFTQLGAWFDVRHQYACAAQAYQSAAKLDPHSARVFYLLGAGLTSAGDADGATGALHQSIKLAPAVLAPHLKLAAALEQLQRKDEAKSEWEAALKIAPRSVPALDGLSKHLIAEGNYAPVVHLLRSAPKDENLALDLAQAYGKSGMLNEASEVLTKALSVKPVSLRLTNALTTVMVNRGFLQEASKLTERLAKSQPGNLEAQRLHLRVLVLNSDWAVAHPLARSLLARSPHDAYFLYVNGMLERQAGDYAAARDHLLQAVTLDPDFYNSHYNLGLAFAKLNDPRRAKEQFERVIALGTQEPDVRFQLAKVLETLGENEEAQKQLQLYREMADANSKRSLAEGKAVQAEHELAAANAEKAVSLYREALDATPNDALLAYKLSVALDKIGDISAEQSMLERAVQIDPDMAIAHNQLGYLASRSGDSVSAEEHFRQAVRAAPGFVDAWVNLAATLGMESKFAEAQEAISKALLLEPTNAAAQQLRHELTAQGQH